jgi:hypothetical protein
MANYNLPSRAPEMFAKLLDSDGSVTPAERQRRAELGIIEAVESQRRAELGFPDAVTRSSLHLWKPGDPISTLKYRLIVGVATYSTYDLQLLDRIDDYARSHIETLWIDVFSWLDCLSLEQIAQYVPGLAQVYHTPISGLWENGAFVKGESGKPARDLIEMVLSGPFH